MIDITSSPPHNFPEVLQEHFRAHLETLGRQEIEIEPINLSYPSSDSDTPDTNGVLGGLIGYVYGGYLHITLFWVSEDQRGKGIGKSLIAFAEEVAVKRGCRFVTVDTFSFSAYGFYIKQGYKRLANVPGGFEWRAERIYLLKSLPEPVPTSDESSKEEGLIRLSPTFDPALWSTMVEGMDRYNSAYDPTFNFNYAPFRIAPAPSIISTNKLEYGIDGYSGASFLVARHIWVHPSTSKDRRNEIVEGLLDKLYESAAARTCEGGIVVYVFDFMGLPMEPFTKRNYRSIFLLDGWFGGTATLNVMLCPGKLID